MSTSSLLKKQDIFNVKPLEANQISTIAKDLSSKLCLAFPEHNLNRSDLCERFALLNMCFASLPQDSSGAKYIAKSNSIYFNEEIDFTQIPDVAMHECIHYLQFNTPGNDGTKIGLADYSFGVALNEAAVQLMASEANMESESKEKYFGITLKTASPTYYPLECAIVSEMAYFTGTFALYHSVLNSNDVFRNTFISKFNKKIYDTIVRKLDKLLNLENTLGFYATELMATEKINTIRQLNKLIETQKETIATLFYEIQNFIIENCFVCEFNNIKTASDLHDFKYSLYNFKNIIGHSDDYMFYNDFYRDIMEQLIVKKEEVARLGELSLFDNSNTYLAVVNNTKTIFSLAHILIAKVRKLFKVNNSVSERNY